MLFFVILFVIALFLGNTLLIIATTTTKSISDSWNDEWVEAGVSYTYKKTYYIVYYDATLEIILNQDNKPFEVCRHEVWDHKKTFIEGSWEITLLDLNATGTSVGIHYNNSILESKNFSFKSRGYEYMIDNNGTLLFNDTSIGEEIDTTTEKQLNYNSYSEYTLPLSNFPLDVEDDYLLTVGFYLSPLSNILYFPNETNSEGNGKEYWKWDFVPSPYKTCVENATKSNETTRWNLKINDETQCIDLKSTSIKSSFNKSFNVTLSYVNETSAKTTTLFYGTVTTDGYYELNVRVEKEFGMIIIWSSYLHMERNFTLTGVNVPHNFLRSDIPEGTYNITWSMSLPDETYDAVYSLEKHDKLYQGDNVVVCWSWLKIPGGEFNVMFPAIAVFIFIMSRREKKQLKNNAS